MIKQQTLDDILGQPATVDDLIASLGNLLAEVRNGPNDWENVTLEDYLEAMHAWLDSAKGRIGPNRSWRAVITMLETARFYE